MNTKRDTIIEQINQLAEEQGFKWINNYDKPKSDLIFKHIESGAFSKTNWSNLKQRGKIPLRNSNSYHNNRLKTLCKEYDLTPLTSYINYVTPLKYKCNSCGKIYHRILADIYKCGVCNNFYKSNKGINTITVLRDPHLEYTLYFVYIPLYNAYKIGLYKGNYVKSRFNTSVEILQTKKLPLYQAYYLEQFIVSKYKSFKYKGEKFGGYTEAFNSSVDKKYIMKIMGASFKDVELCELLEHLEADNQQPSFVEIH
jgi:rubredoxin